MTYEDFMLSLGPVADKMPDEPAFQWMEACQMLAQYVEDRGDALSPEDQAMFVGIGGLLSRQGYREFHAHGMVAHLFSSVEIDRDAR